MNCILVKVHMPTVFALPVDAQILSIQVLDLLFGSLWGEKAKILYLSCLIIDPVNYFVFHFTL